MIPMDEVILTSGLQQKRTLPKKEARTLMTELMHQGFDVFCSEVDRYGNMTVIWPASTLVGRQIKE